MHLSTARIMSNKTSTSRLGLKVHPMKMLKLQDVALIWSADGQVVELVAFDGEMCKSLSRNEPSSSYKSNGGGGEGVVREFGSPLLVC